MIQRANYSLFQWVALVAICYRLLIEGSYEYQKQSEKRANEEIEQLAKDQARKEAYLAREKAIAEAQEERKLKDKKATIKVS